MKEAKAFGAVDAPFLFVMLSEPSEGMRAWFWKQLLGCRILKSDVRIVYMLDEAPAGANGRPLKAQFRSADARFRREIKASKAQVVLPMGGDALEALTGIEETIFDARGYVITKELFRQVPLEVWKEVGKYATSNKARGVTKGDPKMKWVKEASDALLGSSFTGTVIPTFTLDHIRTEAFAVKPAFKEDLLRAARANEGTLRLIDRDLKYWSDFGTCIKGGKKVLSKKGILGHEWGDVIAIDIETEGINNEVINLVSFSDGVMTASFEWGDETRKYITNLFKLDRLFALHNSPFDLPRLRANGVKIPEKTKFFDTMYGAVVIQPDLHKGLGRVATVYLDLAPWKWRSLIDADQRYYSAKDAFVTVWLCKQQIAVMKSLGIWNLFTGEGGHPGPGVMATIPELTEMTRKGIRVDVAGAAKWCALLERKMLRYMKLWSRHFPDVNPSSPQQLQSLLYKEWGLPVQETKGDGVSVNELALVKLGSFVEAQRGNINFPGNWHDDARANQRTFDLILKIREVKKILKTYVEPAMLTEKQWVYPQYMPVSKDEEKGGMKLGSKGNTATGRLVAYDPNIQNQPKSVRWLYIPDEPNHCFIQADYKSAELYVLAGASGDQRLMEDLKGDLHQANADRLGVDRKIAKNVTYASQYLASPSKQSEMILGQAHLYVSPSECFSISTGIWNYYTDATAYKQYLIALCNEKKMVRNAFGRVRFFHDGGAPAAVNFIPQSTVADILWCVMAPIAKMCRKYGARLVTTVHDSLLVSCPVEHREIVAQKMKDIMETRFHNVAKNFYIPVSIEVSLPGYSWGQVCCTEPESDTKKPSVCVHCKQRMDWHYLKEKAA